MNIFNIRLSLGLSTTEAGQLVHVTRRTWELWESGKQKMPDAKQELFMQKIKSKQLGKSNVPELVVIIGKWPNNYEQPIDVVSSDNFLSCKPIDIDSDYWVIKSLATERITQRPYVHITKFLRSENEHVIKATKKWTSKLDD